MLKNLKELFRCVCLGLGLVRYLATNISSFREIIDFREVIFTEVILYFVDLYEYHIPYSIIIVFEIYGKDSIKIYFLQFKLTAWEGGLHFLKYINGPGFLSQEWHVKAMCLHLLGA